MKKIYFVNYFDCELAGPVIDSAWKTKKEADKRESELIKLHESGEEGIDGIGVSVFNLENIGKHPWTAEDWQRFNETVDENN